MTRHCILPAASVLLLFLLAAGPFRAETTTATQSSPAQGLSVSVAFVRDTADPRHITCTAEITDLASGEVLAAPKIAFAAGSSARARAGSQSAGGRAEREILLDVSATPQGNSASYVVTQLLNGATVAIHKGSIALQ